MTDASDPEGGRPAELLLVEDNEADAALTRLALSKAWPCSRLTVVTDGEEALRLLLAEGPHAGRRAPDFILLDLNLPRVDGRELHRRLRAHPALAQIPVFVLTGSNADADIVSSYGLQASGYLLKPVNFHRLDEMMSSLPVCLTARLHHQTMGSNI